MCRGRVRDAIWIENEYKTLSDHKILLWRLNSLALCLFIYLLHELMGAS